MRDNIGADRDYENMSREELVALIGGEVDPTSTHQELVMMAMDADTKDI